MLTKFGLLSQSTWNIKKSIRPTKSQNICQIVFAPGFILISKEVAIFCLFSENVKYFKLLDYMHLKNYCSYKYWMWVILSWNTLLKVDSKICAFRPCCILGILKQCDMGFGLCHVGGLLRNSEVGSNKKRLDVSVSLCQAHILSQMALNLWFTFFYDSWFISFSIHSIWCLKK